MNPSQSLPNFNKLYLPTFFTMRKGIKIGTEDINMKKSFQAIPLDLDRLNRYKTYFDLKSQVPLSYLYFLAQRAQISLMLHRDFPLAIPGMVHLTNEMNLYHSIDQNFPLDLEVSVFIEAKPEGSLLPKFVVKYFQNDQMVVECKSGYLAKRKSKKKGKKKRQDKIVESPIVEHSETIYFSKKLGWEYGKISGDINPIHTSNLFAKMVGFKRKIIQGWYSVSKAIEIVESLTKKEAKFIQVHFQNPILLPSNALLEIANINTTSINYLIRSKTEKKIYLTGLIEVG